MHHIAMSTADYSLLCTWFPHVRLQPHGGVKLVGFDAMWLQDPKSDEVDEEAW